MDVIYTINPNSWELPTGPFQVLPKFISQTSSYFPSHFPGLEPSKPVWNSPSVSHYSSPLHSHSWPSALCSTECHFTRHLPWQESEPSHPGSLPVSAWRAGHYTACIRNASAYSLPGLVVVNNLQLHSMDMSSLLLEYGALFFILRIQTGMRHSLHAWEVYNGPEQWDLCIENYFSIVQCSRICMEESGWCSNSDSSIHWLLTKPLSHSEVQIHQVWDWK